jgi:hypothetical protein
MLLWNERPMAWSGQLHESVQTRGVAKISLSSAVGKEISSRSNIDVTLLMVSVSSPMLAPRPHVPEWMTATMIKSYVD